MKLKENKFVKKYLENEKSIYEGIAVTVISALAIVAILTGSFKEITNIQFVKNTSLVKVIIILIIFGVLAGVLYKFARKTARIFMFAVVMVYFLLAGYFSSQTNFDSVSNNPIAQICFLALSGVLAVIAFLYVKDDIFQAVAKIKVSDKTLKIFVAVMGVFLLVLTSVIGVFKFKSYTAPTFDYGIFAQGFEYMKQTGVFKTVVERGYELSHFAVHFSPIFYIALPIYFIVPKPETVAVIQAIMVALPVLPIYLLGKQYKLSNKVTLVIIAIYALFPATVGGILYDFHENCFLTFMILMLIWAVEKKKNILTVVFLLLTLFVKEDAAMYVMLLGAFWIVSRKSRLRGLIFILAGAIYFVIAIKVINSYGLGIMDFRYDNMFYDKQAGFVQMARVFITNPGYVVTQIISNHNGSVIGGGDTVQMDKIGYLIEMFVPVGALIFATGRKYSRYILLGSIIVVSLITTYIYQHQIEFQYNFGHIALFIYLIIMNLADMKPKRGKKLVTCSLIICAIMFMGLILPKAPHYMDTYKANSTKVEKFDKAISLVPNDKSVFTTGWIMPHMAKNLQCYDIGYLNEEHKKDIPEYPDYLLVDEGENSETIGKFAPYINSGKYELVYDGDKENNSSKIVSLYQLKK